MRKFALRWRSTWSRLLCFGFAGLSLITTSATTSALGGMYVDCVGAECGGYTRVLVDPINDSIDSRRCSLSPVVVHVEARRYTSWILGYPPSAASGTGKAPLEFHLTSFYDGIGRKRALRGMTAFGISIEKGGAVSRLLEEAKHEVDQDLKTFAGLKKSYGWVAPVIKKTAQLGEGQGAEVTLYGNEGGVFALKWQNSDALDTLGRLREIGVYEVGDPLIQCYDYERDGASRPATSERFVPKVLGSGPNLIASHDPCGSRPAWVYRTFESKIDFVSSAPSAKGRAGEESVEASLFCTASEYSPQVATCTLLLYLAPKSNRGRSTLDLLIGKDFK